MTARTDSGLPVMLTWYDNSEIFGDGAIKQPRTFLPTFLVPPRDTFGSGDPPVGFNVYNQAYREHVRSHGYQWRDTLQSLVGQSSNVVDFPTEAIAVKTVWWPVRHDGLTAFPVWDNRPTRPIEWGTGIGQLVDQGYFGPLSPNQEQELKSHETHGNEWGVFNRVVAISPFTVTSDTTEIVFFDPTRNDFQNTISRPAKVVPLNRFFHCRLNDSATLERLNNGLMGQLTEKFWGRALTEDDYLALIAVHVTTRETEEWVWTTYWWHDQPDEGFYGSEKPDLLPFPFDQFRMAEALSADLPQAEDGGPHIAFNPYLEAGFALGPTSNCMACHQRAGWTPQGFQDSFPVERGSLAPDDEFFQGNLRTHLLWSLVFRPRPLPAAAQSAEPEARPRGVLWE
ncbi:MAG: hypothetical protein WC314_24720 [Vulcanimicrobiota bacterium]